jgi:excisionase family DNA binding protein
MHDITQQEHLLTTREVARRLRVDNATVRGWAREGLLAAIELPTRGRRHSYRFRESVIDAICENTQTSGGKVNYDTKSYSAPAR